MRVDGKALAEKILAKLRTQVTDLNKRGVMPTLAVIQVGDDPGSTAYIRQKQKAVEKIEAKIILSHQPSAISNQQLQEIIQTFNNDSSVHGLIVQRPLPEGLRADGILPSKDVDGFLPNSPFAVPVAMAVQKILEEIIHTSSVLRHKSIVVIGRGETAGKPIAEAFIKRGCKVTIVHSQTPNPDEIIKTADILISCVGKSNVVRRDNIKKGVILLSVGISRDSKVKLHGDYEEDEIKDVASFYTPTPGGVGPVNVACLMANLYRSCLSLTQSVQLS